MAQSKGMQALLELTASKIQLSDITTAEVFQLEERAAPRGSQFIRGMAYWIAIGDHLFFVKSQAMTADNISAYIVWLLKDKTKILSRDSNLHFQAEFDRSQIGGDIGDIRALRLSGKSIPQLALVPATSPEREKVVNTARRIAEKYSIFQQAIDVAALVLGTDRTNSLIESLGPEEYLSAQTELKVQGRRTQKSKEVMRGIANEIADLTDAKVQVEGKDGNLSNDDAILRTRMPFDLESEDSNLLVFENVADQLQVVYSRFVADGKIAAS